LIPSFRYQSRYYLISLFLSDVKKRSTLENIPDLLDAESDF